MAYTYNNYGVRGDDMDFTRLYDILLLGDSFLSGVGVEADEAIDSHLKKENWRVLNASEAATNPIDYFHKLKLLQQYHLRASHVLVGLFFGNDFQDIAHRNIEPVLEGRFKEMPLEYGVASFMKLEKLRYLIYVVFKKTFTRNLFIHEFERRKRFRTDWCEWFFDHDERLIQEFRRQTYQKMSEAEYLSKSQINAASVAKVSTILNAILRNIPEAGRLHVMLIPDRHYVNGELSTQYDAMKRLLLNRLDSRIDVIDLHGKVSSDMYYPNDGHWNKMGHQFVAAYLLRSSFVSPGAIPDPK